MADKAAAPRTPRKDRRGRSPLAVGIVVLIITAIAVYLGFTKSIPFTSGFQMQAVFDSAVSMRTSSPVRIAGVNVGKVTGVRRQPGTDASIVTMELDEDALPIHKDATLKIRPRIFLEGNFFVDIQPGTPSAPIIGDADTIPISQTAVPVQFDQVLTSLQSNQRRQLQEVLEGLGTALNGEPTQAEDADADPLARGETAAESLNDAAEDSGAALRGTAVVTDALLGTQANDLSRLVASLDGVTSQLDDREGQLQGLIADFDTTMAALATQRVPLQRSIRLLGPTLSTTDRSLASLNASLPDVRGLAVDLQPAMRQLPATIDAGFPWVRQTRALLGPSELRGLAQELRPTTRSLSNVVDASLQLLPQLDLAAQCTTQVLLPAGDVKIDDGALSSGVENYRELYSSLVGFAGESQNFDGNGNYLRLQPGGGGTTITTGGAGTASGQPLYAQVSTPPLGTKPAFPRRKPPIVDSVACKDSRVPDFNAAKVGPADGSTGSQAVSSAKAPDATPVDTAIARSATAGGDATTRGSGEESVAGAIARSLSPWKEAGE